VKDNGDGNGTYDEDPWEKLGAITVHSNKGGVNGAVVAILSDVMNVLRDQNAFV